MPKKRVFISSTGRTGTQFFAKYLNVMIENSVSLHEPGTPWFSKPKKLFGQVKDFGVFHLSFGQGCNDHSMYKLSRDYIAGDITKEAACKNIRLINDKIDVLYGKDTDIIVYSSGHIYGLLDLLDEVYQDCRFVFIMRDPREWIGSALNKIEYSLYGPIEIFFRKISLQPSCIAGDPYASQWKTMSKFEKYCWFYNKLNEIALADMQGKPNFKVFKYEDIFLSAEKTEHFASLLDFATDFESGHVNCHFQPELMERRVDSKKACANWDAWTPEQVKIMEKHCGAMMAQFGYGTEDAWKEKVAAANV